MNKIASVLLLCSGLLLAACGKDNPKPEPSLLGRWNAYQQNELEYSATGQLLSQVDRHDTNYYMVLTQDSLNYYSRNDNTSWGRSTYTRQGNELRYSRNTCTITELTDRTLTLRFNNINGVAPNTPYYDLEEKYTR